MAASSAGRGVTVQLPRTRLLAFYPLCGAASKPSTAGPILRPHSKATPSLYAFLILYAPIPPLLDRTPRGIEPTLYGRILIKRGIAVFDELRHTISDIESLLDPTAGEARIGCTEPLAAGIVPHVVDALNRRHPRMSFQVLEAGFVALEDCEVDGDSFTCF
jgi:hypothetical protein